jgi:DNA-3-methyladenine glycosylase I
MENAIVRCDWISNYPENLAMTRYHDLEWGKESHDNRYLFEMLSLEGMQAGLSWQTIINKRENFKKAFSDFEVEKVANFGESDFERLMSDAGIIRNRLKIASVINNAKKFLEIGDFDQYIWSFTDGKIIDHQIVEGSEIPAHNELSDLISKQMKKDGFKFVGGTIIYSYLQAIGMINDHQQKCEFKY